MAIVDVELLEESKSRYLTYALSVVNSRALPDVRDGLKPVQRRILYAMYHNLRLWPDKHHRKSAAVVGEVLARYHPHGDSACYEAMVRMAQSFSLRYPLVDGQGNFGSLDGDSAAAYRYTEAKLTALALEVVGDIGEETVSTRDNFDQTTVEPVVLPTRVPNLLINGAYGIAVGVATSIPPHNLGDVIKALTLILEDDSVSDARIIAAIKAPDFPTGCAIINSKDELKSIYETGRGAVTMRGTWITEQGHKSRRLIVVNSIPYGVDKSSLIEKIADLIIARKVPQLEDVRDESTQDVRIVLELADSADADKAMAYLFKHTQLQTNFNVNLTALVPTSNPYSGKPELLSLRAMLEYFIRFRVDVTRAKLVFEKSKLEERIHLLEGLVRICDALDEAIAIVRGSEGRQDGAKLLAKRFSLSMEQAYFIVDLRIYQLAKTALSEVQEELREKSTRVTEINHYLESDVRLKVLISNDLKRIADAFGDKRRCSIEYEASVIEIDAEEYVQHEDVHVVVTRDGWLKRIRSTSDPASTRLREGDQILYTACASTRSSLALFTNLGNVFVTKIFELVATTGYGEPVQKMFRFQDGEQIVGVTILSKAQGSSILQGSSGAQGLSDTQGGGVEQGYIMLFTERGYGFRFSLQGLSDTKKTGRRLVKMSEGDRLRGFFVLDRELVLWVSGSGYALVYLANEIPELTNAAKGVILQKIAPDDILVSGVSVSKSSKVRVVCEGSPDKDVDIRSLTIGGRANRGAKVIKKGAPVVGLIRQS